MKIRAQWPSWHISLLILATLLSRLLAYYVFHIRFDYLHVDIGMQLIDPLLLKTRMLESITYLHSQPPLLNLGMGIILKLFPVHYPLVLSLLFKCMGLVQIVAFYWSARELTGRPRLAFYVSLYLAICPAYILYENWFMYTFPAMCLLAFSVALLIRFLRSGSTTWGFAFFSCLAALSLLVSMFHLLWLLLVVVLLAVLQKQLARKIIMAALVPVLLVTAWYIRSEYLFGQFSASSWLGMNLARIALGKPEQQATIMSDSAYIIAQQGNFKPIAAYEPYMPPDNRYTSIPVLQQKIKSTGVDNLNNLGYIYVSNQFKTAAFHAIKTKPFQYLDMVSIAHMLYFAPSSEYFYLKPNRDKMDWYDRLFTLGRLKGYKYMGVANFILLALYLIVFIRTGRLLVRHRAANKAGGFSWQDTVILYASFNILFLFVVGNWMEIGENMRFRFYVIPLFLLVAAWCLPATKTRSLH